MKKIYFTFNYGGIYSFSVLITAGLTPATSQLITSYTDQLLKDGLLTRILNLLDQISVSGELDRLAKGRAIGDARHRRQLMEMIEDQRSSLADCLFLWAVQTPFGKDETIQIITHLRKMKLPGEEASSQTNGGGQSSSSVAAPRPLQSISTVGKVTVDMVTVSLCLMVMACFNIGEDSVDLSDDSLLDDHFPLLSDSSFLPAMHTELTNVRRDRISLCSLCVCVCMEQILAWPPELSRWLSW